jgi:hypothetical protein
MISLHDLAEHARIAVDELRALVNQAGLELTKAHEARIRSLLGEVRKQREQSR